MTMDGFEQEKRDAMEAQAREVLGDLGKQYPQFTNLNDDQKLGVMQTIIKAVLDDEKFQYRQTLRTASFADAKQSRLCGGALSECERYGAPLSPIINAIEAQNGERGPHGVRGMTLEALTHTNISTNYHPDKGSGGNSPKRGNPM